MLSLEVSLKKEMILACSVAHSKELILVAQKQNRPR